ncbi:MAG TPA: DUF3261 domain-containing protein [Thermoanaerobaculia bacterium]|nr:DUF3261 domain-containing protein [Thermoanaerobaculia bacterium]
MRRFILVILLVGCAHVSGPKIAPLPPSQSPIEALLARAAEFPGARSIMNVRATAGGETRTLKAQLIVHDRQRMQLIAYTPIGTTAATITADGDRVTVEDAIHGATVAGNAASMLQPYGFFTAGLTPAEMGMLLLGYPPRPDQQYEADAAGLKRVQFGDVVVTYDPPALPARHVVVTHGKDVVDVQQLEVAAMGSGL